MSFVGPESSFWYFGVDIRELFICLVVGSKCKGAWLSACTVK